MEKKLIIVSTNKIMDVSNSEIEGCFIFSEKAKDTIGNSGANSTWGEVFVCENQNIEYKGIALHKNYDFDYPNSAYCEKILSIIGRKLFKENIRIPKIDIAKGRYGEDILSYILLDNDTEDMIHIRDTLFNKFSRDEIKVQKDIFTLEDILECVGLEINDEEQFKKIEKSMINILLLDAITNNADRHALNWALIRNKKTNQYDMAAYDHSSALVDIIDEKEYATSNGWSSAFVTVGSDIRRHEMGSTGNNIIEYIYNKYPEYVIEFTKNYEQNIEDIILEIKREKMPINENRLEKKLLSRLSFLKHLIEKGERLYE